MNIINSTFTDHNINCSLIFNDCANTNIINSNFTQNNVHTKSVIYNEYGNLVINHSIITDNNFNLNIPVIYSTHNFTLKNSIIIENIGNITFNSENTFISPIVNEELSSEENVIFKIGNNTYTAQKNETNYVITTQVMPITEKPVVMIEYPSFNENNTIELVYNISKAKIQNVTLPGQTTPVFTDAQIIVVINDTNNRQLKGDIQQQ